MSDFSTESRCIKTIQQSLSDCSWVVGEAASTWMNRYARGLGDAELGMAVGLSAEQVRQRRVVWEKCEHLRAVYPYLAWSHFYAALAWDDAPVCLQWADDMLATVAEMKAWRRAQRGEDLRPPEPQQSQW